MSPQDYLLSLYDALEGLPAQVRADIINEYKEYFRIEAEIGRADEDIIASLGDPTELAKVIKNQRGYHYAPPPPHSNGPIKTHRFAFRRIIKWIIVVIVLMGMTSGIGFAIKFNSKGMGNMAFGFGSRYDVNESKAIDFGSADKIEILAASPDTRIVAANGDQVKAMLTGYVITTGSNAVPALEITKSGQIITIAVRQERSMAAGFSTINLKLDIEIPKDFSGDIIHHGASGDLTMNGFRLNSLTAEITSGDVMMNNLTIENRLNVSTNSGNISIREASADSAAMRSTSGDKVLDAFKIHGDMEIKSNSGNTRVDGLSCSKLSGESTSGNVTLSRITADTVFYMTHSGNVVIKELDGAANIEATSGNIQIDVPAPKGEYHLAAHSGNVRLGFPAQTSFSLDARVNSGDIRCDFDLRDINNEKRALSGIAGSGEIPVVISTTSGNIHIIKR